MARRQAGKQRLGCRGAGGLAAATRRAPRGEGSPRRTQRPQAARAEDAVAGPRAAAWGRDRQCVSLLRLTGPERSRHRLQRWGARMRGTRGVSRGKKKGRSFSLGRRQTLRKDSEGFLCTAKATEKVTVTDSLLHRITARNTSCAETQVRAAE